MCMSKTECIILFHPSIHPHYWLLLKFALTELHKKIYKHFGMISVQCLSILKIFTLQLQSYGTLFVFFISNDNSSLLWPNFIAILQDLSDEGTVLFDFEDFLFCCFRIIGLCSWKNSIFPHLYNDIELHICILLLFFFCIGGRLDSDIIMVVGFTTTCAISAYYHWSCEFELCSWWGVLDTLCDKACQWLATGWWFSPVSSINKTDHHDITEILLKVVLNTIN